MNKRRVRVVNASTQSTEASNAPIVIQSRPDVIMSDNPRPSSKLSENEIRARVQRRYATSTTLGGNMNRFAGDVIDSGSANFYSPQLSTDFLEKPQNLRERRAFYRFMYNTNEFVGQSIDIHTYLPLSKLRLVPPKGRNKHQNNYVFKFFQDMIEEMKLFKSLIEATHEFNLFGVTFIFAEDSDYADILDPEERSRAKELAKQKSEFLKQKFEISDKDPLYKGWKKILILPPDQVRARNLPLTDGLAIEYVPDPETKKFITSEMPLYPDVMANDPVQRIPKYEIPSELRERVMQSGAIPLDTDPNTGSFVFALTGRKSQYEPFGQSRVERCVNTLVYMDKLRQAQTSIASRHMTPMRIVWAEQLNPDDVDQLREQVDLALVDPDYSIIANYEVHWEEMGSQGRLLDIDAEIESCANRLFAGLGVTREILTGEGTYTGSKISLEIMNQQYLLFRELIQDYVENYLFKPVARKKGFIEIDDYGNEVLLYPRLSFTRLAIRDNEQFFDAAFQLYQKGSISVDLILDILNIDPASTREKLEQDLFTVNDSQFNEVLRNLYTNVSTALVEQTDFTQKLAKYLKLNFKPPEEPAAEGASRFSTDKNVAEEDRKKKRAKVIAYFDEHPEMLDKIFPEGKPNGQSG